MNSKAAVVIGLIVALVVLTVPFWYALGQRITGQSDPPPTWEFPDGEKCVEADMRASHMELLARWRDEVVREGVTDEYHSEYSGKSHERSLTKTCLACHAKYLGNPPAGETGEMLTVRQQFCQQCHDYANVRPNCWDCHREGSP